MKWLAIILTALFAGAKLAGVIAWSWWLVFLPAIIYVGFYVAIVVVGLFVFGVADFLIGFKGGLDDENSKHEDR